MDDGLSNHNYPLLLTIPALVLISIGCLVMTGWLFEISTLVQIRPNLVAMQFNSAFCFALSGLILLLYYQKKYTLVNLLTAIVVIISLLTLVEYYALMNIGIDTFFVQPFASIQSAIPGRMAPNSALSFVLFALFIYLSQIRFDKLLLLVVLLPCVYGVLGLISLIGYLFDIEQAYAWGSLAHMAPHSAIALLFLSFGSLVLIRLKGSLSQKQMSSLFDYAIFSASLLFFLLLWQVVRINYINSVKTELTNQVTLVSAKLLVEIDNDIDAILRLFSRFGSNSYRNAEAFQRDVDLYFTHIPSLEEIRFGSGDGQVKTLHNPDNTDKLPTFCEINGLGTHEQGGYLCVADGRSAALINLKTVVMNFTHNESGNFVIAIADNGNQIYESAALTNEYRQVWDVTKNLPLYGSVWSITVYPSAAYIQQTIGSIPSLILVLGALSSLLILYVLRYRRQLIDKEKALLSSEVVKSTILNSTVEGVFGVNQQFRIYFMNESAQKLLGVPFDKQTNMTLGEIIRNSQKQDDLTATILHSLSEGKALNKDTGFFVKANGVTIPVRYSSAPIVENSEITGAIVVFADNSERLMYEEKLQELAHYDTLTKLPNRFSILAHLSECIARARRHHYNFSLCFIDIDHFKGINDNYGHHVGDKALQHVSDTIKGMIRSNDFLGRLAGDEFCLILDWTGSKEDAERVLDKINRALHKPMVFEGQVIPVVPSIGVIAYNGEETPEELLMKADSAMYQVKKQKRDHRMA